MECNDVNCPKHGTLAARGMILEGTVVSAKMQKTAIVQRDYYVKVKKYDRFKRSRSRIPAHNPPCIDAKEGDIVRIMECRKLGKTVNFVIMEKLPGKGTQSKEKAEVRKEIVEKAAEEKKEEPKEPKKEARKEKKKSKVKNG